MKITHTPEPSMDDLAATAIRLGRELAGMVEELFLGATGPRTVFMSKVLRHLAERNAFDPRDEQSLEALGGMLADALKSEAIGTERRFFESRHDEFGQHGEIRECPVYSERGEELLAILKTFKEFVLAREATLDRVVAERALRQLLAS